MSSSYIIEPQESGSEKKDDTLIIVVNDDGTISVDQETLQNLIMNQSNANVSVVRLGQGDADAENGEITLTVDPPAFTQQSVNPISGGTTTVTDTSGLVDPFMEMDPEQLERLETALQSEEAKQILGENVTAMLDMLSVEEQQNSIRYSVELDHCYTSRLSPSDPKPRDPLPIAHSPGSSDAQYTQGSSPPRTMSTMSSPVSDIDSTTPKAKPIVKTGKPVGRPRKNALLTSPNLSGPTRSLVNTIGGPKASGQHHPVQRNVTNALQQQGANKVHARTNEDDDDEEGTSSSTESSESEPPSDNDSDFGPRGPRRGNVRARGGRKGLTTRGGSMTAARRRGPNKHLDMEQVRRLDMEMAAAVNAMKSPEKDDKSGRFSPIKGKRQVKVMGGRKKDDSQLLFQTTPSTTEDPPVPIEKPLQTTNQVKANLINANMIKGDMILTKPGQAKSAQRVHYVQKQVLMKANDIKTIGLKKQVMIPKGKLINQVTTKFFTTKDGKLIQLPTAPNKAVPSSPSVCQPKGTLSQVSVVQQPAQVQPQPLQQQSPKPVLSATVTKLKPEIKKEKRRADNGLTDLLQKEIEPAKPTMVINTPPATVGIAVTPIVTPVTPGPVATVGVCPTTPTTSAEAKALENAKKHPKKDHRKSPGYVVDSLGPALFSTPDIIRRVSGGSEMRLSETSPSMPSTPTTTTVTSPGPSGLPSLVTQIASPPSVASTSTVAPIVAQTSTSSAVTKVTVMGPTGEEATLSEQQLSGNSENQTPIQTNDTARKVDSRPPFQTEELQSSLDPGGIEGEEHLLATLEMEASKHEEELLAEALLLQEELGVDLADHPALVDQTPTTTEPLQPPTVLVPSITSTEHELSKSLDTITTASMSTMAREPTKKPKDDKEPIQIVRGGRIITLPPIEAPATRSKRLQAKNDCVQKPVDIVKKVEKFNPQVIALQQQQLQLQQAEEMRSAMEEEEEEDEEDDEDEDEEEEDNSDSEDDPDRLWCICKRPHNNRFMICCDVCEDWFHGKCVHVSKAMGQQMEEKGIEWVCPNCLKKKTDEIKNAKFGMPPGKQKPRSESVSENSIDVRQITSSQVGLSPTREAPSSSILPTAEQTVVQYQGTTQCVVCKKEARNSSIYCSDACILAHAQETLTKDKPVPSGSNTKVVRSPQSEPTKTPPLPDARIIVFERKTGRVLTGADAPTRSNLKQWLKENPTFEVVRPNSLNTLQIGGKTVTAIQTQGLNKAGKSPQLSAAKIQTLPKMIYAKVAGSRQTILTASNKKLLVVASPQQQGQANASQVGGRVTPLKQTLISNANKAPIILKHPSPKTIVQTQAKTQQQVGITVQRQTPIKKQETPKASISQAKQQTKLPLSTPKKPETEPIRINIRKTLTELLSTRIKETDDLKLTDEEINDLAFNIELEMYKYFKDTGAKYKAKYRSLVFNIKDTKNLTLFRKIADRSLTPDAVVRLSPDEMASQELAEWREKETKHQLEMIKKNELDLMAQAKSIVVKTHKGEQIIENDGSIDHVDPKTPVQDIVTALNSADNVTTTGAGGSSNAVLTTATSTSGILASVSDDSERERRESVKEDDKLRIKESKKLKGVEEKRKRDREKESRLRGKNERSVSRERHRRRHSRDREHSRTREKSRERKSNVASTRGGKESRRDKDRDREKDKDRERNKDRDRGRNRERGRERVRPREQKHKGVDEIHLRNRSGSRHRETKVATALDKRLEDEHRRRELDRKGEYGSSQQITPPLAGTMSEKEKPIEDRLWRHIEDEASTNTIDGNDSDVSDREPTSTVTIKTPDINEDAEREKEHEETERETPKSVAPSVGISTATHHTVWRGFVNMVDVAKFFITAQEVSGLAKDLMDDLPDTVDVVGRISHETVWDYISKMKKTGSKEILVIRLTAANDEEKIPYITLYSYLNSRSRLGVVGNVSKNIKDFYIMPFSNQSTIPPVLLPLTGPGFEEHRPHLLLGIIVRNKRKRLAGIPPTVVPSKLSKKETDRSYTPPLISSIPKDKGSNSSGGLAVTSPAAAAAAVVAAAAAAAAAAMTSITTTTTTTLLPSSSPPIRYHKDKQLVTQMTLDSLNKAHIGMSRTAIDTAAICKIVPELSSKLDLTSSPGKVPLDDDGDEPYSPGEMDDDMNMQGVSDSAATSALLSSSKNSNELQRKMDELNRQIEEQKQQIQNISSSFLGEATSTLPGLGLDPPSVNDCDEAYSPSDSRSFTPPPPGISKFAQPILDKVSDITIPPNLQEILANVKRQESSKVDPYLPSKPSASFLPTVNSSIYQTTEKYAPTTKSMTNLIQTTTPVKVAPEKLTFDVPQQIAAAASKESSNSSINSGGKSTLSSLSDLDLIRKAEEELAAVAAAAAAASATPQLSNASSSTPLMTNNPCDTSIAHNSMQTAVAAATMDRVSVPPPAIDVLPSVTGPATPLMMQLPPPLSSPPDPMGAGSSTPTYASSIADTFKKTYAPEQPKPPGLEDEDFPAFPSTPPTMDSNSKMLARCKFAPKSGVVLSVKRKVNDDGSLLPSPTKAPRTKSRWGQGPSE